MVKAYYKTGFGLTGCYLDDSQGGAQCFTTRRELADAIRNELEVYEFPKAAFAEVNIRRLWRAIVNAKSASSYTFHIHHKQHVMTFYGLTEREYLEDRANGDDADDEDREALRLYDEGLPSRRAPKGAFPLDQLWNLREDGTQWHTFASFHATCLTRRACSNATASYGSALTASRKATGHSSGTRRVTMMARPLRS